MLRARVDVAGDDDRIHDDRRLRIGHPAGDDAAVALGPRRDRVGQRLERDSEDGEELERLGIPHG